MQSPPLLPEEALQTASRLAKRWDFEWIEELPAGYCSRVFASPDLVLKVPWRGEERTSGAIAAKHLGSSVGPKVHRHDPATGSLLMDRVRPAISLAQVEATDEDRLEVTLALLRKVPLEPIPGLIRLEDYYSVPGPFLGELAGEPSTERFLHGDLHPENVLRGRGGEWRAIDPKGLVGDAAYEAVAFLRNPLGRLPSGPALVELQRKRVLWFASELRVEPWRIAAWLAVDQFEEAAESAKSAELLEVATRLALELR